MRRLTWLLGVALAVSLVVVPAGAKPKPPKMITKSKTYELAGEGLCCTSRTDPSCRVACSLAKDGTLDQGGVDFPAIGGKSKSVLIVTVSVKDDLNPFGVVNIDACQNTNGDTTCGGAGEPSVSKCLAPGQTAKLTGVARAFPIRVFIAAVSGCPGLLDTEGNGGGTSGTVKITYPAS